MKKCNYCGRENADAAVACSGCGKPLDAARAPEPAADLRDPALAPVVVATFSSLQEASILVDRLAAAGVEATIPEEYEQVFSGIIPLTRLTVRVAAKDYQAALEVLNEGADSSEQPK